MQNIVCVILCKNCAKTCDSSVYSSFYSTGNAYSSSITPVLSSKQFTNLQLTNKWSQTCCFYISVISYLSFSSFYAVIWSKKLLHYLFISTNHLFIFQHEWMETFSTLEFICKLPCLLLKFIYSVKDGCNFYVWKVKLTVCIVSYSLLLMQKGFPVI